MPEDDPVPVTGGRYPPALHALPAEDRLKTIHFLLFLRQPGSIRGGNRLGFEDFE